MRFHLLVYYKIKRNIEKIPYPYKGPSLPIAETIITPFAVNSHTLSTNGWSIKSGPPILRFSTVTFVRIA